MRTHQSSFKLLQIEQQDNIKKIFKEFFAFLSKSFEVDIFYTKSSTDIKKEISTVCFGDGTKINFKYLTLSNNRREIKNKKLNLRISYNENYVDTRVDIRQTELSIRANLIHATDAYFARLVILRFGCLTIHDCFCLKLYDINTCIDFMNKFFHNEILKNTASRAELGDVSVAYSLTIIY